MLTIGTQPFCGRGSSLRLPINMHTCSSLSSRSIKAHPASLLSWPASYQQLSQAKLSNFCST